MITSSEVVTIIALNHTASAAGAGQMEGAALHNLETVVCPVRSKREYLEGEAHGS